MKFVMHNEMPSSGEFIAIWTYEGMLRSDNLIWEDGKLYYWQFNEETTDYEKREIESYPNDFGEEILTYITLPKNSK
jgi:hypothetical protein